MNEPPATVRAGGPRVRVARFAGVALLLGYAGVRAALEARYRLFDPDEALEMLAAASLLAGKLPYLGALSHRGPFLTVLYAVPCALAGPNAYRAVHAFCIMLFLALGVWFQAGVARATSERVGLLALANLVLLGTVRVPSEDTWGLNSDFLMGGLATVAMALLLRARAAPHAPTGAPFARASGTYACVGLLLALALLTKQNGATYIAVPVVYIVLCDRTRLAAKLTALAGGFVAPLALTLSAYAASGSVHRAWYFFFEYNRAYAAAAYGLGPLAAVPRFASWLVRSYAELLVLGVLGAATVSFAPDRRPAWLLAVAWTVAGVAAAIAPGKCWDNYLWACHAPLALLAALGADSLLLRVEESALPPARKRIGAAAVLAVPLLGCLAQLRRGEAVLAQATDVGGIPPPRVSRQELLGVIARVVPADGTIYVSGYAPEMYVLSARRPATDHVVSNFVETVYPGRFDAPSALSPRFFGELRDDLQRTRPQLIVDACKLGFLCHPSSALTAAMPLLLADYEPLAGAPVGLYVRRE